MLKIERKPFFDTIRPLFPKGLRQSVVNGFEFILSTWERQYQDRTPITQFANILGQTMVESAATFQPIQEYGNRDYYTRMYDINGARPEKARELGNIYPGDGAKFPGMGYIQSTGRGNARRNTRKLRALGIIGPEVDFEVNPELMMKPEYAVHIMFIGMEEGWFTGRKLDDIIDADIDGDEHADFIRARAIINGTDKAGLIADYSDKFLLALKRAQRTAAPGEMPAKPKPPATAAEVIAEVGAAETAAKPVEVPKPKPPEAPAPVPPTPANPEPKGWFAHLLDLMRSHRGP